jgi:putative oxygen-independent coproporphyrinogen III oxidase
MTPANLATTPPAATPASAAPPPISSASSASIIPAASIAPAAVGAGVYVHFPFCLAKCPYCDFVSYAAPKPTEIDHAGYADAVLRELHARAPLVAAREIETVFFGGGTPSLWEPAQLGRVLEGIRRALATSSHLEVTVECNPPTLDEDRARALADVGVNRVSIGVQSLDDERLLHLGRLHDAEGGRAAVRGALRAGLRRVSADLIFGLPRQSAEAAREEARQLADLGLDHLSCYQLTIEPGTRFGELAKRGRLPLADEGAVADSFLAVDEGLREAGFRHYEVSNFARPGEEARHNLGYWRGHEYLGLGCAAVGFVRRKGEGSRAGIRYRNATLPDRFVAATRDARPTAPGCGDGISESSEDLDADTLLRERIMLGLRIEEGIDIEAAARTLETPGWTSDRLRAAALLEGRGRIVREGGRVRIPQPAWLWADDTAARLI